ncbi:MAG: PLP-dependent aminotransferase family protein [Bauldia litoralis]
MTIWIPPIEAITGPRYQAIATAIGDAIEQGTLKPGDRLPPQRDLAWRLGVTVGTVSRGYTLAEQRGLVSGEVGRGTFVREAAASGTGALLGPPDSSVVDLGINATMSAYHGEVLSRTLQEIGRASHLERLLRYMPGAGHPEYRAAGAAWIAQLGIETSGDRVVLTNGAQQGIAATFAALLGPREPVLCEALTYTGVIDNARLFGHPLVPVDMDEEGMMPAALDAAISESGARVAILQPTIQNPTAAMMGEARRREIVAVARKRDLILIEDDVYGLLPPERPAPIAVLAPERTIYLTSASKAIAPGLRVGWLHAPVAYVERLVDAVYGMSASMPALMQEVARRWIEDGTARELVRRLRVETAERQRIAREALAGLEVKTHPAAFHVMLTLPLPWRREEYADTLRAQGVRVIPLSAFATGQQAAPHGVRISLSAAPDRPALVGALERIRSLALSDGGSRRAVI